MKLCILAGLALIAFVGGINDDTSTLLITFAAAVILIVARMWAEEEIQTEGLIRFITAFTSIRSILHKIRIQVFGCVDTYQLLLIEEALANMQDEEI